MNCSRMLSIGLVLGIWLASQPAARGQDKKADGNVIMNVAGREHGLATIAELRFVQASFEAALAIVQLSSYRGIHSKSLLASESKNLRHTLRLGKHRRISSSPGNIAAKQRRLRLVRV